MLNELVFFMKLKIMKERFPSIPQKKYFLKGIRVSTGKHSYEGYIDFVNGFSRRRIVMAEARVTTFCRKVGWDNGYSNGREILSRSCEERNQNFYF